MPVNVFFDCKEREPLSSIMNYLLNCFLTVNIFLSLLIPSRVSLGILAQKDRREKLVILGLM